ncbi:MAG: tyrosine-type recombinase/integrase, partial [Candidatus Aenigmatarchaeota archaeon]
ANVRKIIGYLERPNTSMWILDPQYRLFTFKRGPHWDEFMGLHKSLQEGEPVPEEPGQPEVGIAEPSPEQPAEMKPEAEPEEPAPEQPEEEPPEEEVAAPKVEATEREVRWSDAIHAAESEQSKLSPAEVIEEAEKELPEPPAEPQPPEEEPEVEERPDIHIQKKVPEKEPEPVSEKPSEKGADFLVGKRKLPRVLSEQEIADMIRISKPMARDALLLQCMYFLGMSNAEVQNMRVEDIDFANARVKISQGRNRRDRTLPMPEELKKDLMNYVGARSEGFLIRGRDKKGKRISDRHIRRLVKAYAEEAGIKNYEDIHPHTLRHSYAMHLLEQGTPIESVQNVLGHERLETTAIYSQIRNTQKLREHVNSALEGK